MFSTLYQNHPKRCNVGDTLRALIYDEEGNEVNPDDVDAEIQWSADGVEITDATDAEYTVLVGDEGVVLSVEVTIGDETYTAETEKVEAAPVEVLTVSIDNTTPKVGDILTASVLPAEATNLTYAWYLGGTSESCTTLIEDATTATLEVDETMVGKFIKVQVTGEGSSSATAVTKEAVPDVITVVALKTAEQTSANGVKLTFDQDAKETVKKENITVEDEDGTLVIPVNSISFTSEDGTVADIVLSANLKDGHSYKVSFGESASSFTASVGAVKTVVIKTDKAEVNTKTKIEFALFDEKNVDVTSTQNIDATCTVTVTGDATYDVAKASDANLTMTEKGKTANVKVVYNSGETGAADITTEGVVTCIAATQTVGTGKYSTSSDLNLNSECAKFYKSGTDETGKQVSVEVGASKLVYFCAVDEKGDAIAYDSYDVESSHDDIANVSIGRDSGKFATITVSGNVVGSANIIVTATKNGEDTPYTIPVTVTEKGKLASITATATKTKISNAKEKDYYGEVKVKAYDTNGNDITSKCIITAETVNAENKEGLAVKEAWGFAPLYDPSASDEENRDAAKAAGLGFFTHDYGDGDIDYTAWCAQGGSQSIKVSVSEDDIVKEKTVGVTVETLPSEIWNNSYNEKKKDGVKLTYSVELKDETIKEEAKTEDGAAKIAAGTTTARLAAFAGGKFAGYVRQSDIGTISIGDTLGTMLASNAETNNATDDGLVFRADEAGTAWNNYEFVVKAGQVGQEEVEAVKEVKIPKTTNKVYFKALGDGEAAGEAGNKYAFKIDNETITAGVKGIYEVTFDKYWSAGDTFKFDEEWFVASDAVDKVAAADSAKEVAKEFKAWVDKTYKDVYKATLTTGATTVTLTQEYPSKTKHIAEVKTENIDTQLDGTVVSAPKTGEPAAADPGNDGTKGKWEITFGGPWTENDTVVFDGKTFKADNTVTTDATAAAAFKVWIDSEFEGTYTTGAYTIGDKKVTIEQAKADRHDNLAKVGDVTTKGTPGVVKVTFAGAWAEDDTIVFDDATFVADETVTGDDDDAKAAAAATAFGAWINDTFDDEDGYTVAVAGKVVTITQKIPSKTASLAEVGAVTSTGTATPDNAKAVPTFGTATPDVKAAPVDPVREEVTLDDSDPEKPVITIFMTKDGAYQTAAYVKNLWATHASEELQDLFEISDDATKAVTGQDFVEGVPASVEYEPLVGGTLNGTITYTYSADVAAIEDPDDRLEAAMEEYETLANLYALAEDGSLIPSMFAITNGVVAPYADEYAITLGGTDPIKVGSSVLASKETTIAFGSITQGVKMGNKYATAEGDSKANLYDSANNIKWDKEDLAGYATKLTIDAINNDTVPFYVSGDTSKDGVFAKKGAYTVTFNYKVNDKDASATKNLTVDNALYIPKVSVTSRVVDSLTASSIVEKLTADVDMNNNDSAYASINDGGVYSAVSAYGVTTDAEENNGKLTVKYVGVVEDGVMVFVPINATFRTE